MAHVVGVPRRDPCQKCQLPVFLAERLAVGKKVYHRTCLKCARCGSQLTPGSFYETEVDDEYCCETCPDEEEISNEATTSSVLLRNNASDHSHEIAASTSAVGASASVPPVKHVRGSIADRLAFFENSKADEDNKSSVGHKLLQKSVSDEEKTKSLKHMEAKAAQYKMNTAFNSFLNDTIDGENEPEAESDAASTTADSKTETQMETSDTETDNEASNELALDNAPPALPKTQPPAEVATATAPTTTAPEATANKRFTATAQLQLSTSPIETTAKETPEKKKSELQLNLTAVTTTTATAPIAVPRTTTSDNSNNNDSYSASMNEQDSTANETTANQKLTHRSKEINLVLSETNDNDCVTKDKTADTVKAAVQTQSISTDNNSERISSDEVQTIGATTDADIAIADAVELRHKSQAQTQPQQQLRTEDAATTERLSVVRARLQQFEVIANNKNNNNHLDNNNETASPENSITTIAPANSLTETSKPLTRESSIKSKLEETDTETENEIKCETKSETVMEIEEVRKTETKTKTETVTEKPEEMPKTEPMEFENEMSKSVNEVPLNMKTKDNEIVAIKVVEGREETEEPVEEILKETERATTMEHNISEIKSIASTSGSEGSAKSNTRRSSEDYPDDLNPFKSDEEDEAPTDFNKYVESNKENLRHSVNSNSTPLKKSVQEAQNLNPFDSSDDEIELEKSHSSTAASTPSTKVPPPRPPPPRISRNPFGDDAEEDQNFSRRSSLSSSFTKKTPVPTPRSNLSQSQNPTPEPTPRLSTKSTQERNSQSVLQNSSDYYGSVNSLSSNATPQSLQRNSDARGSNNSLTSSAGGTIRGRKNRRAPAPPPPPVKELFPSNDTLNSSITSTPSSSTVGTPKSGRKKRIAPAPPKPARMDPDLLPQITLEHNTNVTASKNLHSYPLQSELDSTLSDEEKALLEGKQLLAQVKVNTEDAESRRSSRRLIPLDASLLNDEYADDEVGVGKSDDVKHEQQSVHNTEESNVVYRRVIIPPNIDTPTHDKNSLLDDLSGTETHDRQLEKLKDNKEAQNRNRQSQISASSGAEDGETLHYNKSVHGKWKRRKGPAPALPIPPRKVLQMLPLQEIRHELDIIEVQQQGLEKQGVILEKMIRDRCEGHNGEPLGKLNEDVSDGRSAATADNVQNSKEVEDLILQLFELVNEKNELFRRQAELMYLRRQHRLEQEQADLEYEIRVLMAQPECNKTDTDKAREEALIARLVEVVQLRNEVIECLEMDRLREAEEDLSIKQQLELHSAKREDEDESRKTLTKLSKKEKKKQKEAKKLGKTKKIDADKDADETELQLADKQKLKKKKRTLTNLLKL